MRPIAISIVLVLTGCASQVRFADRQVLWKDTDDKPVPIPAERELSDNWVRLRAGVFTPVDDALAFQQNSEAKNVNALDELPDSTWFTDRRRAAALAGKPFGPAEVGADPAVVPDTSGPLTIVEGKISGSSRGFVVEDQKKNRFMLKLDAPGYYALATSTEVVASRLVRAAGWNTPDLTNIEVPRSQLVVSEKAKIKNPRGKKRRFTAEDVEVFFKDVPQAPDGSYHFTASAWLKGKLVGSYSYIGRRKDDPNDRVPHEDRRDLRGYRVFCAWINNVDTVEQNTIDEYVGEPGQGHIVHYQQDVGGSFGNYAVGALASWMGYESYFDGPRILLSFLALGGYQRAWARDTIDQERARTIKKWPELGWFEADHFEPEKWSPLWFNSAFDRATDRDKYWGAKRVLQFSAEEVKAAIAAGHYRTEAAERLFQVLWSRRERIGRVYLDKLTPFEALRFEGEDLCFDDLMVAYGFDGRPAEHRVDGAGPVVLGEGARRCVRVSPGAGYRIVSLQVKRQGARAFTRPLRVHYLSERGQHRILGLER